MMIDFSITETGDLYLEPFEQKTQVFRLSFRLSNESSFRLSFHTGWQEEKKSDAQFRLSFKTKAKKDNTVLARAVTGIEEKVQRIRLALMTELGELEARPNIGSKLSLFKHENRYDKDVLDRIQSYVQDALVDILPDIQVVAKPERGKGYLYAQNVNLYIYNQGKLIFTFSI